MACCTQAPSGELRLEGNQPTPAKHAGCLYCGALALRYKHLGCFSYLWFTASLVYRPPSPQNFFQKTIFGSFLI